MQQIKTVVYKDLELDDKGVNHWLSQGWKVYDLATSVTLNEESEAGNGMTVIRIFTLIRDIPDATKAPDAPRKSMGITSPVWQPKVGEQVWTETSDDRMVSGVITELVPQKDGFMVQWSDSKLPIPVFENRKSVTDIPF